METKSFSHRYFESKQNLLDRLPKSLVNFFEGAAVKLLVDDRKVPEEKNEFYKQLLKNRDLRALMGDRDFGHYTQWVDADGQITIHQSFRQSGMDDVYIEQILHEIGHFLESGDDRIFMPDWGLKWPKDYQKDCSFSVTALRREMTVTIYDIVLRRILDIPVQPVLRFGNALLYAALNATNKYDILHLPEIKSLGYKGNSVDQVLIKYTHDRAAEISDETLLAEWHRKNDLVRARMSQQLQTV